MSISGPQRYPLPAHPTPHCEHDNVLYSTEFSSALLCIRRPEMLKLILHFLLQKKVFLSEMIWTAEVLKKCDSALLHSQNDEHRTTRRQESFCYSPDTRLYPLDGQCSRRWRDRGWVGHSHRLSLAYSHVSDPQHSLPYRGHTWKSPNDTEETDPLYRWWGWASMFIHHYHAIELRQWACWTYCVSQLCVQYMAEQKLNSVLITQHFSFHWPCCWLFIVNWVHLVVFQDYGMLNVCKLLFDAALAADFPKKVTVIYVT